MCVRPSTHCYSGTVFIIILERVGTSMTMDVTVMLLNDKQHFNFYIMAISARLRG